MMMRMRVWMAAAVMVGGAAAVRGQENLPLPTAEEVRKQVGAGEFREALRGISRIVVLKGPAAAGYDRGEMLMLRGECQLQLKDTKAALDSLDLAYKEAVAGGKEDGWVPLALAALIQNSKGMQYTPKGKTGPLAPKPINILDREARKEAYKALFEDQLTAVKNKVAAAQSARTMAPIMDAAKTAGTLRALEKAGTGATTESKAMTEELSHHATILLAGSINEMTVRTDSISTMANQVISVPIPRYDPTTRQSYLDQILKRRGLATDDPQTLKGVMTTCTQIIGAARELATNLGVEVDSYKDLAATAAKLGEKASVTLKENYDAAVN